MSSTPAAIREQANIAAASEPPSSIAGPLVADAELASIDKSTTGNLLVRGANAGRYVIIDVIGTGGMAVVYSAYDPSLDRKVAIKVLSGEQDQGRSSLWREAQTMAKLLHPNVTAVFEVGMVGERVFLAMEYVAGRDLRKWVKEEKPNWRTILELFLQAGRGLAAAHKQGIVHRDFKPENVMVGNEGDVHVTDFGIARVSKETASAHDIQQLPEIVGSHVSYATEHGSFAGTPAYMAPEQYTMGKLDARTDLYSYCVALFEMLYGGNAFTGKTLRELRSSILAGQIAQRPKDSTVPRWLHNLVVRGTAVDPANRYVSMDDLLSKLERRAKLRHRRWLVLGALLTSFATVLGVGLSGSRHPDAVCTGGLPKWTGVWDATRKQAVSGALRRAGGDAVEVWPRVEALLDHHVDSWSTVHRDTCEATHVRGEQSEALLDGRMACLERRRHEVADLVALFEAADPVTVRNAVLAANSLTSLQQCSEASVRLGSKDLPKDDKQRKELSEIYASLSRAKAYFDLGEYKDALLIANPTVARARALADARVLAESLLQLGVAQWKAGDSETASTTLVEAVANAQSSGGEHIRSEALIALVSVDGVDRQLFENSRSWNLLAEASLQTLDDDVLAGRLADDYSTVLFRQGNNVGAFESATRATTFLTRALPPGHLDFARNLTNLGTFLSYMGRHDEARKSCEASVAIRRAALGSNHPDVSEALNNLANVLAEMGLEEEALSNHEQALAGWRRALGEGHPYVALSLENVGVVLLNQGRHDEALGRFTEALEIEKINGKEDHPNVAFALNQIGSTYLQMGNFAAAIDAYRKAVGILDTPVNRNHTYLGMTMTNLGIAQLNSGAPAEALASLEVALERRTVRNLQDARTMRPCRNSECDVSETKFALARTLDALRRDRPRAMKLAREAYQSFENAGKGWEDEATEVDGWIHDHD